MHVPIDQFSGRLICDFFYNGYYTITSGKLQRWWRIRFYLFRRMVYDPWD